MAAITGTAAISLSGTLSVAGAGKMGKSGTAAVTLPSTLSVAGAGKMGKSGTAAVTLKALTTAVSGLSLQDLAGFEGEPELVGGVHHQNGTSYTIQHSDRDCLITFQNTNPVAVTIPEAVGAFGVGFKVEIVNLGSGVVTITPSAGQINLAANKVLLQNQSTTVFSDGGDWYAKW